MHVRAQLGGAHLHVNEGVGRSALTYDSCLQRGSRNKNNHQRRGGHIGYADSCAHGAPPRVCPRSQVFIVLGCRGFNFPVIMR